jgi:hypothetical protein
VKLMLAAQSKILVVPKIRTHTVIFDGVETFIPKSTTTVAASSRIPGTACWRNFRVVLGAVRSAVEIQRGMIPIGLSSIATISIFAHWPLALRAEATT